jgi:predicted phage-related endonuclease
MAQADDLPSPIHDSFPDGSETRPKGPSEPAANKSNKEAEARAARPPVSGSAPKLSHRRHFVGGSDARIIMGNDEHALVRLWRESAARSNQRTCPAISSSNSG